MAASKERHDALCSEITRLEDQIVRMNEDQRQQSSMHEAIVSGLESQCELLSEQKENARDELATLDEANAHLQNSCNKLKQQLVHSEALSNQFTDDVEKLTLNAIVHARELGGFSSILAEPSTKWADNLAFIAQFIDHAQRTIKRFHSLPSEGQVQPDAVTPKMANSSRDTGSGPVSTINFMSDEVLNDMKNMKDAIGKMLMSPKFTPLKLDMSSSEGNCRDEDDSFLYSLLLQSQERLESLTTQIESFHDSQRQWEGRESSLESRILELEQGSHNMSEAEQAKMKEASLVMMSNFQRRYHRGPMQNAFQIWRSQAKMSKHMAIAKEMARELAQTRKKVLLLKSRME